MRLTVGIENYIKKQMTYDNFPERNTALSPLECRVNPLRLSDTYAYREECQRMWRQQLFTWVDQGLFNGSPFPDGARKFTLVIAGQQSVLEVVDPTADGSIESQDKPMLWTWAAPSLSLGGYETAIEAMDVAIALYENGEYTGVQL
jgi:hypothetical protein